MNKQLIIGAGTGRCGTTTLAHFLNMQPYAHVTHERFTRRFRWNAADRWMNKIQDGFAQHTAGLYGDVALQHGCCLPAWCDAGARIVVLKREIEPYLVSWKKKAGPRNNWQPPGEGGTPGKSPWYHCFPKFSGHATRREALIAYWKHYYEELVPAVADQYPDQVQVFYVDVFNTPAGQRRLLDFCGVDQAHQVLNVGMKKNRSKK